MDSQGLRKQIQIGAVMPIVSTLELRAIALLETIEDAIDSQTYEERRKRDFDDPDDCEYSINITAGLYRRVGALLRDYAAAGKPEPK
jgi:hypothetical protein